MKCTDKIAYETRGEAWDFAKTIRKSKHRHGSVFIYQCQFCGKWHLTHKRTIRYKSRLLALNKYYFDELTE